ncbi:MAG: TRAP transporter large permease subunit, partial [Pseudomonadota bacterium]
MQITVLVLLLILVIAAVPVAAVLGVLGLALDEIFMGGRRSRMLGDFVWEQSIEYILVAVPMFILLGEIVLRAGIAQRMYGAVAKWLSWLPGGLMHANVGSCAIFAATSGSSVATVATVGTVAYPEIEKRRYNESLFLGTLAAGGTLGILIPPSINLILYGLLTDTSVPELYLAGVLPGVALALLFMLVVIVACFVRPDWGGEPVRATWAERFEALPDLLPPLLLFTVVVGS